MSSAHEKQITALKEEISRLENLLAERPGDQQKSLAAAIGPESDSNSVVVQALLESEETLLGILNNVEDAVMTIDGTGTLYSFNTSAEKMFGYPADVIIGQNIKLLMPEPHRGQHDIYVKAYQTSGESQILGKGPRESEGLRKDGGLFPVDLSISEMQISGQRRFIGTIRDISERQYAERAFRENSEELDAIYRHRHRRLQWAISALQ
jgi:PAS domain S-box-containing protein